jgi:hypothetical protein
MNTKTQSNITSFPNFFSPTKQLISSAIFSKQPTSLFEYCLQHICNTIQYYEIKELQKAENSQFGSLERINYLEYLNAEILSELIKRVSDCTLLSCGVIKSFPLESLLQLDLRVC